MNDFEQLLRQLYPPELPYGFAERTARAAMESGSSAFWDLLLGLTPRAGMAIGAVATALILLGFAGSGPGLFDALDQYSHLGSIVSLP